jgi:hypothetical protein
MGESPGQNKEQALSPKEVKGSRAPRARLVQDLS